MTHHPGPEGGEQPPPSQQPPPGGPWQPQPYPPPAWGAAPGGYPVPPPPPPQNRWGTGRIVLVTLGGLLLVCGLLVALVVAVGSLGLPTPEPAPRDGQGRITEAADVDKSDLRTGDCLNDRALVELEVGKDMQTFGATVAAVPCADPHDFEVIATFTLPDGDYSAAESIRTTADRQCFRRLRQDFGQDRRLVRNMLLAYYLPPPTDPLGSNVVCMLQRASGERMRGTLR